MYLEQLRIEIMIRLDIVCVCKNVCLATTKQGVEEAFLLFFRRLKIFFFSRVAKVKKIRTKEFVQNFRTGDTTSLSNRRKFKPERFLRLLRER